MTANPDVYVARRATERALEALVASVTRGRGPVALLGPGGLGKTMLLRVLGRRLGPEFETIYVPFPKLEQSEICALALGLVGHPPCEFPEEALLALACERRAAGGALALLIDDASSMPRQASRGLAGLAAATHGGLRLVLAADDDARAASLIDNFGPGVDVVRLADPMDVGETGQYLRRRIGHHLGDEAARCIDPVTVARIHGKSRGNPRRLHFLVDRVLSDD